MIPYVQGGRVYRSSSARRVTNEDHSCGIPRPDTPNAGISSRRVRANWSAHGILAVFAALALALLADGAVLLFLSPGW